MNFLSTNRLALVAALLLTLRANGGDDPAQSLRASAMRQLAEAVNVRTSGGARVELVKEPVYRWDDPARRFGDGTIWVYGNSGRPAALLTLSLNKTANDGLEWLHELSALTDTRFSAQSSDGWLWTPGAPAMAFNPIPNAPQPAGDEAKLGRQLTEQARRFKAFEFFDAASEGRPQRYELRLLAKPVYRYKDPARGILDGGVFLIAYGRNPEIALVIEAIADGKTPPRWLYGLGRIAAAELHVTLDERDITPWPRNEVHNGPNRPYHVFGLPVADQKLAR